MNAPQILGKENARPGQTLTLPRLLRELTPYSRYLEYEGSTSPLDRVDVRDVAAVLEKHKYLVDRRHSDRCFSLDGPLMTITLDGHSPYFAGSRYKSERELPPSARLAGYLIFGKKDEGSKVIVRAHDYHRWRIFPTSSPARKEKYLCEAQDIKGAMIIIDTTGISCHEKNNILDDIMRLYK